jgi:hypothetical protein
LSRRAGSFSEVHAMGQPALKGGGPREEQAEQQVQKRESRIESSLGSRGMSRQDMLGHREIRSLLGDMKGSIGGAVRGFFGRLLGKKQS